MRRLVAIAFASLATALPVLGQPVEDDSTDVVGVAPLEVRILRTAAELERVPYSVAVNTVRDIQLGRPGLSVEEALRAIPGVQIDNRYNYALGERITIRGFGARAQFGVKGIRILVDGLPATLPDGQSSLTHVDVQALGRVEVIRGPAAALYGNTAGGVIQMESEAPAVGALAQEVAVTAGSAGLLRVRSTTEGRSGDVFHQITVSRLGFDGYREHSRARNLFLSGRVGLDRGANRFRIVVNAADSDALNPGSLSKAQQEEDRFQAHPGNVSQATGKTVREGIFGATWERAGAAGDLELAAYVGMRNVRNPIPSDVVEFSRTGAGARALFRSRPAGALGVQWALGAEADRQRDDRQNYANEGGRNGALRLDQLEHVHNVGVYGQLSATPAPRLTVTGALRYDWFRFEAADRFITDSDPDDSGSRTMDAFSPSIGATLALSDRIQLYGNVGTTFETPTTTELANRPDRAGGFNAELEPQRAVSVELGARGRPHDAVSFQLAAYHAAVENALIPFEVPDAPARRYYRNAGSASHRGIELGAGFDPSPRFSLRAAYTFTQARFEDYSVGGVSYEGNDIPGIAPHRAELTAVLRGNGDAAASWFAAVENRYTSRLAADDANAAYSPSSFVTDFRAGFERVRAGAVELSPFLGITNVFDVEYDASVTVNAFGGRFFETGPGRSFYLGGSVRLAAR